MTNNTERLQKVTQLLYLINSLSQQLTILLHMIHIHKMTGMVNEDNADMLATKGIDEFIKSINSIMSELTVLELKHSATRPQSDNEGN